MFSQYFGNVAALVMVWLITLTLQHNTEDSSIAKKDHFEEEISTVLKRFEKRERTRGTGRTTAGTLGATVAAGGTTGRTRGTAGGNGETTGGNGESTGGNGESTGRNDEITWINGETTRKLKSTGGNAGTTGGDGETTGLSESSIIVSAYRFVDSTEAARKYDIPFCYPVQKTAQEVVCLSPNQCVDIVYTAKELICEID